MPPPIDLLPAFSALHGLGIDTENYVMNSTHLCRVCMSVFAMKRDSDPEWNLHNEDFRVRWRKMDTQCALLLESPEAPPLLTDDGMYGDVRERETSWGHLALPTPAGSYSFAYVPLGEAFVARRFVPEGWYAERTERNHVSVAPVMHRLFSRIFSRLEDPSNTWGKNQRKWHLDALAEVGRKFKQTKDCDEKGTD